MVRRLSGIVAEIQSARSLFWAFEMAVSTRTASLSPCISVQAMGDHGPPYLPFGFDHGMAGATCTLARSWLMFDYYLTRARRRSSTDSVEHGEQEREFEISERSWALTSTLLRLKACLFVVEY